MSNPSVRKAVINGISAVLPQLQGKLGINLSEVGTDIQRYMKLRSM